MQKLIVIIIMCTGLWFLWPKLFPENKPVFSPSSPEMSDADRAYYQSIFNYVMDNIEPGKAYVWESYSGKGSIIGDAPFTSKSRSTCRNYKDQLTTGAGTAIMEGVACKRKGVDGWCRIKKGNPQTCALEAPSGVVDETKRNVNDAVETGKDVMGKVKGTLR